MISFIKIYIASVLFSFLIIFSWINSYEYNCIVLFFPIVIWSIISYSFIELKMQERLCFRDCFLRENSIFAKMLSSRWFVTFIYMVLAIMMTISALIASIDLDQKLWIYIFTLHILSVTILYKSFDYILYDSVNSSYRKLIAREWSINIMSIVLISVTIYSYYRGYEPDYLVDGLKESIINASNTISSKCEIVDSLLKIYKEIDAFFWWVITNSSRYIDDTPIKLGAWLLFFLFNSLAILGINRFIVQVIYMIDNIFERGAK